MVERDENGRFTDCERQKRKNNGFVEHWALIWLGRFDSVYEYKGNCACNPMSSCPCDEMYEKRECHCHVIFKPEDMASNKYAKKHGIEVTDDGDSIIIKMPKINIE